MSHAGQDKTARLGLWLLAIGLTAVAGTIVRAADTDADVFTSSLNVKRVLIEYYEQMSTSQPVAVRTGEDFEAYRADASQRLLRAFNLDPLPLRVSLDARYSDTIDHRWCTIQRVYYQIWPGVYGQGLLYLPKNMAENPATGMLCPHGHWPNDNAYPDVQRRCLYFSKLGYITFSPYVPHYEDLPLGISYTTVQVWGTMRALDFLETVPGVDADRLGCCGASGGGMQTEFLTALDNRIKAASIVGYTTPIRTVMLPDRHHCPCNHVPSLLRVGDHPEISTLGLPAAVQYVTMNDWTRPFAQQTFPSIQKLYEAHDAGDSVDCRYDETDHMYDQRKREWTYWWMEKILRGKSGPVQAEPSIDIIPPEQLTALVIQGGEGKGYSEISNVYRTERGYQPATITRTDEWTLYRERMRAALSELIGDNAKIPRRTGAQRLDRQVDGDLVIEHWLYPSEGGIRIPAAVVYRAGSADKRPIAVLCSAGGSRALADSEVSPLAQRLAGEGALVVLPDIRFTGRYDLAMMEDLSVPLESGAFGPSVASKPHWLTPPGAFGPTTPVSMESAWQRNALVWGRPLAGMGSTDVRAVLDNLAYRSDVDMSDVRVISRQSGGAAAAVLFAAALDDRITVVDVDLLDACYAKRNLPVVPFVLQHGDVLQWASLLADRKLTLTRCPPEAGDPSWLAGVFAAAGNSDGLTMR